MAICDANYNFLAVDSGAYGGNSYGSVFAFWKKVAVQKIENTITSGVTKQYHRESSFYCRRYATFPLKLNIMRPYPGKKSTSNTGEFQ